MRLKEGWKGLPLWGKLALIILVVLFSMIGFGYALLFTPPGNGILRPYVEKRIEAKLGGVDVDLRVFRLTSSTAEIVLRVPDFGANVKVNGGYSLFSKSFDFHYNVELEDLGTLSNLNSKLELLRGRIETEGDIKGVPDDYRLEGALRLADGTIPYDCVFGKGKPRKVELSSDGVEIRELARYFQAPEIYSGLLKGHAVVEFDSDGGISAADMELRSDRLTPISGAMAKLGLPEISEADGSLFVKATLKDGRSDVKAKLESCLGRLDVAGGAPLKKPEKVAARYNLTVSKLGLAVVNRLAGTRFSGSSLDVGGELEWNSESGKIFFSATTKSFGGNACCAVTAADGGWKGIDVDVDGARLAKLLAFSGQPVFSDAAVSISADITRSSGGKMNGECSLKLLDGVLNPDVVAQAIGRPCPAKKFSLGSRLKFLGTEVVGEVRLATDIGSARSKELKVALGGGTSEFRFDIDVPDLSKLSGIANRELRGAAKISVRGKSENGEIVATASTKSFGGDIVAKLSGKRIKILVKDSNTLAILRLFDYPEVFDSKINAEIDYDLSKYLGKARLELGRGGLPKSALTALIAQVAKFDVTKEVYEKSTIDGTIKEGVFKGRLAMLSPKTKITSDNLEFNTRLSTIKARLLIDYKNGKRKFHVDVAGPIKKPSLTPDTKDMIEEGAKEIVNKTVKDKKTKALLNSIIDVLDKAIKKKGD